MQRNRAFSNPDRKTYDYIRELTASNIADRLFDINKQFYCGLELGCSRGDLLLPNIDPQKLHFLFQTDSCEAALSPKPQFPFLMHADLLQFKQNTFDVALSNLSLHWVDNLENLFSKIRSVLTPDSPFIISMFGESTLFELSSSLRETEMELLKGFSPRVSPFIRISDMANLLDAAGFTLITADQDYVTVRYPGMLELMRDLGRMGESNCTLSRNVHIRRDVIRGAEEEYKRRFADTDGSVPATFEIIFGIGWTPCIKK